MILPSRKLRLPDHQLRYTGTLRLGQISHVLSIATQLAKNELFA